MRTCEGLSLTEVLVSLLIVTSASLSLIQQQWHVSQFTHQIYHRNSVLSQLDNSAEQWIVKRVFQSRRPTVLVASWQTDTFSGDLKRTMVVSE